MELWGELTARLRNREKYKKANEEAIVRIVRKN